MYWWMGSGMRPRPWWVSTPRIGERLAVAGLEEAVAVHRAHGDRLEARLAHDHELHVLLDPREPEPPVEFGLARHRGAVDAHDDIAWPKTSGARRPDGRDAGHHHAAVVAPARVETEARTG